MPRSAKVTSIEMLWQFKPALLAFEQDVRGALELLAMEVQRAAEWIEHDRTQFWPAEVNRAWDKRTRAKIDLERARLQTVGDHEPSCYEEKAALQSADRNLHEAEEKVERVQHWRRSLGHEFDEFQAQLARINTWLDAEHPKVVAALVKLGQALDRYTAGYTPPVAEGIKTAPSHEPEQDAAPEDETET